MCRGHVYSSPAVKSVRQDWADPELVSIKRKILGSSVASNSGTNNLAITKTAKYLMQRHIAQQAQLSKLFASLLELSKDRNGQPYPRWILLFAMYTTPVSFHIFNWFLFFFLLHLTYRRKTTIIEPLLNTDGLRAWTIILPMMVMASN